MSTDDGTAGESTRARLSALFGGSDLLMVAALMAFIYLAFLAVTTAIGLNFVGTVNTLRNVTYFVAAYAMLVLALNLHWGYTGLFNIGVAGFMAVGVYTMGILTAAPTGTPPGLGLPLWVGIVGGMLGAAIVGGIAALPALRLDADYLAIVTVAFSEIIRLAVNSNTLQEFTIAGVTLGTGGGRGISYPAPSQPIRGLFYQNPGSPASPVTPLGQTVFTFFEGFGLGRSVVLDSFYTLAIIVVAFLFYVLLVRIGNSPFGRVLKAIREDELVASSLGKDTRLFKIKAFMVGCALMGLGGILWLGASGFVNPLSFRPNVTFYIFIALIIGGAGSNTGAVLGAGVFSALLFLLPQLINQNAGQFIGRGVTPDTIVGAVAPLANFDVLPLVAYAVGNMASLRFVLVGVLLIWLMQNRPQGLLGHRSEVASTIDLSERSGSPPAGRPAADGGETDE
jgi:branched-chain amino acid transport system permease protein